MLFAEALQKLQDGVAMRRSAWPEIEGYLKLMPGMGHVWKIVLQPNPNAGNFIFSVADFLGDDWVEYVFVEKTEEAVAEAVNDSE